MSTNDYIRQAAQKYHWHKYYSGFMRYAKNTRDFSHGMN